MYAVDYHTHSCCSPDSSARLLDMAKAAQRVGLRELCTTDHCDLQQEDGSTLGTWDWTPILTQYEEAELLSRRSDFRLLLGIELGGAHTDPQRAADLLSGVPLDFVIGSVHNLNPAAGGRDFYFLDYTTQDYCHQVLDDYFASLLALAPLPTYDSLGHIIYPLRYMKNVRDGQVTLERYEEILRAIFTAAAETGRGIELNTYCGRTLEEWLPTLKLYRACGGEIVTTGSDAHTAENIGKGIQEAQELLRAAGFRHQAVYQQRTPQFIRL